MVAVWEQEIGAYVTAAHARQLTEESPQADQPDWIRTPLRPHQRTLLAAARNLEMRAAWGGGAAQMLTHYGCLTDRVGAGKSLVALSLVRDPPPASDKIATLVRGGATLLTHTQMPAAAAELPAEWMDLEPEALADAFGMDTWYTRAALCIVPHNILSQWESYIKDHTTLRAVIVKRVKDCDWTVVGFLQRALTADLVLVSNTMVQRYLAAVRRAGPNRTAGIVWSRLFIDEADTIPLAVREHDLRARFTWFITGSWLNMLFPDGLHEQTIQHFAEPLRSLLGGGGHIAGIRSPVNIVNGLVAHTRNPAFTAMILRNRDAWIDVSVAQPVVRHETVLCATPPNLGLLQEFITPAALEALHAGDTAGAMAAMGLKASPKESIVETVTASLRGEVAQAEKILAFKHELTFSSPAAKTEAIAKAEAKVARLRAQLAALESRLTAATAGEACPVCYDTPTAPTLTPCCRQAFCLSCICSCLATKAACPLCRVPIAGPQALLVLGDGPGSSSGAEAAGAGTTLPTKGAALTALLTASTPDQRFLVFSAHEASFKGLQERLAIAGVRCEVLQGTGARVDRLRRQFRDGTVRVLCMNARHVGAGLNLEAATHVVLYHKMNVELEKQVIGRAVRFERSGELNVIHLVHAQETAGNGAMHSDVIVHEV